MKKLAAHIASFLPAALATWTGVALVCWTAHAQQASDEDGMKLAAHYSPHRGSVDSSKRSTALLSNSSPIFSEGTENSSSFKSSPDFADPPAEYRPHHMNHEFTSPRTRDRWTPEMLAAMSAKVELGNTPRAGAFATLDQLLANKAGGTVINVAWTDRWIEDPGNIHNLGQAARLLSSKGLRVWLYDEYFYPSGWAKGLAVQGQPENQARNLAFITHKGSGAKQLSFRLPADGIRFEYAAFYPNNSTTDGSRAVPVPVQETSVARSGFKTVEG